MAASITSCSESKKTQASPSEKEALSEQTVESSDDKSPVKTLKAQYTLQAKKAIQDIGKLNTESLAKKYSLKTSEGSTKISAMLTGSEDLDVEALKELGVDLQSKTGDIQSALVPLDQLGNLSGIKGLKQIDIPAKSNPK